MKNLVFAILIVFVPVMLTGCQKGENIVEKLTPEPTLEEKYGEETIAMLEASIPDWRNRLREAEEARNVWAGTKKKKVAEKESRLENDLTMGEHLMATTALENLHELHKDVARCRFRNMNIARARVHVRDQYYLPPDPRSKPGIEEGIDRMIIAVYILGVSSQEARESALLGKYYLLPLQKRVLAETGF